ncbi:MAG TPA: isoprenylcysteine carboxylmethyltransferase family protein [Bdellovibrionota bacterium]|nr:isoprenylcysteine carboxylmethyltransferase family protein [Bdellovibrionota bacterium]
MLAAIVINATQPSVQFTELARTIPTGGANNFCLYVAGIICFLVPVLDRAFLSKSEASLLNPMSLGGLVLMLVGMSWRLWSIASLGSAFSSVAEIRPAQTIVTTGPYRYLRHPSYFGSIVMFVGIDVLLQSMWGGLATVAILIPAYLFRMRVEEAMLLDEFGEQYQAYQRTTRGLIPYIF